jgi:hypothetical protein
VDNLFFPALLRPLLVPLPNNTAAWPSLVNDDASERSPGRTKGSNEVGNIRLDTREIRHELASSCNSNFYAGLTTGWRRPVSELFDR